MKKKAIEKIPYFGLKKTSRKKDVKYIGVTAVKIVGHEKHLFLEVYRNKKESKEIPMVRIVLTKKDFGTYWPEKEEWTRQKIKPDSCYGRVIWGEEHPTWEQEKKENILQSTEDLERIKKFCKANVYNEEHWWEYIYKHEDDIVTTARQNRKHKVYMRRQEALADRMAHTKELPEKEILERADRLYFHNQHYLYYKKHGCWAHIACSKCGGVTDARWKSGISYESQFQRWTEEPREGHYGTCPMCGARGEYKCQGKVKDTCDKYIYLFLGQKYKENGMVMRYVKVGKKWTLGFICGDKGPKMYNASEELSGVEIARAYFEPGKKVQIDYHKHDPYTGKDFWDDCNLYGMANIPISAGLIMSETYEEMKGTIFQYSALQEYAKNVREVNPIDYLERYSQTPQIEVLVKMGLTDVVEKLVKCYYGIVADAVNPYSPRQKGAVENAVKQVQKSIIKPLQGVRFFNIDQVNARLTPMLKELNDKPMVGRAGLSRRELAYRELPMLRDLPQPDYELSMIIKSLTVRKDGCIRLGNARYSVPAKSSFGLTASLCVKTSTGNLQNRPSTATWNI